MEKIYLRWYVCSAQLRYFLMFNLRILYLKYFRSHGEKMTVTVVEIVLR
jgi:hypothetical protein